MSDFFDREAIRNRKKALYSGCSLSEADAQVMSDYIAKLEDLLDESDAFDVHGDGGWRNRAFGPQEE